MGGTTKLRDELRWLDATAQAELVRRGEVKAAEVVEAAIERIEAVDGTLNAVTFSSEHAGQQTIIGRGAGGMETASAVLRATLVADFTASVNGASVVSASPKMARSTGIKRCIS